MKKKIVAFFFFFFALITMHAQCAMCRAVLESEEGQKAAEGVNNGIVYLMIIPYLIVGVFIFYFYRKYKAKA